MTARVLVVDDLLPNLRLLEAKLTNEYYDVQLAHNGIEALERVQENLPDIILLDVMMPEMDGFETCRRLKADPKFSHIPVVMVTALSDVDDRVQGLQAGADDFLTKPINDLALFARIRSLVRLKVVIDELRLRDQTSLELGMDDDCSMSLMSTEGAKILIIDDDMAQGQHISTTLRKVGNDTTLDDNIETIVDRASDGSWDLIVVSTQLLDVDGLRLCSQIRSRERAVPLLIVVDEDDTNLLVKGLDMGVNDYIISPVDGNELITRANTQIRRKRYQEALKENFQKSVNMAMTDALTGLYNRRYFDVHYKNLCDQARFSFKPLSIMIADIDFFKKVNDNYGHVAGDEILQQVPDCIRENVRITDLASRYGGEEFVIVMPDSTLENTMRVAERLREAVQEKVFKISCEPGTLRCTLSLGVATIFPNDTPETLLKRADKGLYMAKENGRNQVGVGPIE